MYAIIATGGKQYKVEEGDVIKVEKLGVDAGETVTFDQVLAVNNGELQIGCPTVAGATVTATVEQEGKEAFTEDSFEGEAGQEDVQFSFRFTSQISPESKLLINSLVLGLQNIERDYGKSYIIIRFEEV